MLCGISQDLNPKTFGMSAIQELGAQAIGLRSFRFGVLGFRVGGVRDQASGFSRDFPTHQSPQVTPGDVFCTLDADSTGTLSIDEFRRVH